jgi:hypothetical protein
MTRKRPVDWRANIEADLPEVEARFHAQSFPSAIELIKIAAFNRRMTVEDYVGRAALAFAVYDSQGEITWESATDKEPPLRDLRRHNLPRLRLRGRGFGNWRIEGLR